MNWSGIWISVLAVSGCVTTAYSEPVAGPDGMPGWWAIHCKHGVSRCYAMAGKQCPQGYDIAGSESTHGAIANSFGSTVVVTPTYRGEMIVKCRSRATVTNSSSSE